MKSNTIIVTGAGTGLGKELAILFAKEGYHPILMGRTRATLEAVAAELPQATPIVLDITNKTSIDNAIHMIQTEHDCVGLVNNAGVGHFGPLTSLTKEQVEEMLTTNVLGTIFMTQAVLPHIADKPDSFLMNIISTAGLRGKVNESVYVASKFAVRGFTESLQKEYEQQPIHISAVYMGGMNTPFWHDRDHVKDPSRFWTAREVAEQIFTSRTQPEIVIESKKA